MAAKRCPSSCQKQTSGKGLRCKGTQNFVLSYRHFGVYQVTQMVKNLLAMQETWVWSLGQEGPLEKEMATHSSILAWRIPWTEKSGRLQSMGLQRVRQDWATNTYIQLDHLGQKNVREGVQPHSSANNWIKALLSKALPTRARTGFSYHQSLSWGSLYKPLSLLHQRADRNENHSSTET